MIKDTILEVKRYSNEKLTQTLWYNESRVKNGYVRRKQRYKCKECGKTYREEDLRERYSNEQRLRVIKWIRKFSKILRQKLNETPIPENTKDIAILELVELFSYCQKN